MLLISSYVFIKQKFNFYIFIYFGEEKANVFVSKKRLPKKKPFLDHKITQAISSYKN